MRYALKMLLVVLWCMINMIATGADEVFTVESKEGYKLTLPVPDRYMPPGAEGYDKLVASRSSTIILKPDAEYAKYLQDWYNDYDGTIIIHRIPYTELYERTGINDFAGVKERFFSESNITGMKQSFQAVMDGIAKIDKERSSITSKLLGDNSRSASVLIVSDLYYKDGSHKVEYAVRCHVGMNNEILTVSYMSPFSEPETRNFFNSFIQEIIELNLAGVDGRKDLPREAVVVAGKKKRPSVKDSDLAGINEEEQQRRVVNRPSEDNASRRTLARDGKMWQIFAAVDFPEMLPFEFTFEYPTHWNTFELQHNQIISYTAEDEFYLALGIKATILEVPEALKGYAAEDLDKQQLLAALRQCAAAESPQVRENRIERIGKYLVGIFEVDFYKTTDGRKERYKGTRFFIGSGNKRIVLSAMFYGVYNSARGQEFLEKYNEFIHEARTALATLDIEAESTVLVQEAKTEAAGLDSFKLDKTLDAADYPELFQTPIVVKYPDDFEIKTNDGYLRLVNSSGTFPVVVISFRSTEIELSEDVKQEPEEFYTKIQSKLVLELPQLAADAENYSKEKLEISGYTVVSEKFERPKEFLGIKHRDYSHAYWVFKGYKHLELVLDVIGQDTPEGRAEARKIFEEYDAVLRAMIGTLRFE